MKKLITILLLFFAFTSYSQEAGVLLKKKGEALKLINAFYPDHSYNIIEENGTETIRLNLDNQSCFLFKFKNEFCYHEEYRTTNMEYNIDSIENILREYYEVDGFGNYFYQIDEYRFYYQIVRNDNYYRSIKTIRIYEP